MNDDIIARKLELIEIASKWFMQFNTVTMDYKELKEYRDELELHKVTDEEKSFINDKMTDLYIIFLENKIKKLEEEKNERN